MNKLLKEGMALIVISLLFLSMFIYVLFMLKISLITILVLISNFLISLIFVFGVLIIIYSYDVQLKCKKFLEGLLDRNKDK